MIIIIIIMISENLCMLVPCSCSFVLVHHYFIIDIIDIIFPLLFINVVYCHSRYRYISLCILHVVVIVSCKYMHMYHFVISTSHSQFLINDRGSCRGVSKLAHLNEIYNRVQLVLSYLTWLKKHERRKHHDMKEIEG
jgi:hypothetical protein